MCLSKVPATQTSPYTDLDCYCAEEQLVHGTCNMFMVTCTGRLAVLCLLKVLLSVDSLAQMTNGEQYM